MVVWGIVIILLFLGIIYKFLLFLSDEEDIFDYKK